MAKRQFRIALAVVVATVTIAALAAVFVVKQALSYPNKAHKGDGSEVAVTVERGMSFPRIARRLADKGLVSKPRWFRLYAMHRGATTKVRSGNYLIKNDQTPKEVLNKLLEGVKAETVKVTIPEGLNMLEVFAILGKAGVADAKALETLARDRAFLTTLGIDGDSIEGYLFPLTYDFIVPTPPKKVLKRLVRRFRIVWDKVRRQHAKPIKQLKKKLGWTDRDILVMASIVEKEAVVKAEQGTISQVFVNRLTFSSFSPKRLETDPTIRYGCTVPLQKSAACQKFDGGHLKRIHLRDQDNPYNTYKHEGLPPGPICSPGKGALEAAANPDGSKFLFFVARDKARHVFSRTRKQHEKAVADYLKFRRQQKAAP